MSSMNIYAKKGQKVLVSKVTAHNGDNGDKEQVAKYLQIGKIYNILSTNVSGFSTSVILEQFPDLTWNSVNFIDYVDRPKGKDFMEPIRPHLFCEEAFQFALRMWEYENAEQIEARNMYKEGNTKLAETEIIVSTIKVHGKNVNGCLRHKKEIMISFQKENEQTIFDLFLTKKQVSTFYEDLIIVMQNNHNG
jgi:hypothetical protein